MPNADLEIRSSQRPIRLPPPRLFPSKTDAAGQFSFSAPSDDVLSVWARAGSAVSDGAKVAIASRLRGEPLRIVVSERFAFRLSGKVVDRRGRPIDAAVATAVWIDDVERNGGQATSVLHQGKLPPTQDRASEASIGADGMFSCGALWPDLYYHLVVTADGCQTWESRLLFGGRGENRDLGTIVLNRSQQSVEGRVVDAKGQGVEDAAIINSGDGPAPLRAKSGADGRFRLESLTDGPVYLLVRKPGYWPVGARREAGDAGFDVVLVDSASTRAVSNVRRQNTVSADERQLTLHGLTKLWQLRDRFQTAAGRRGRFSSAKARLIDCMASIDLEQALRWSAAEGGKYEYDARLAAAKRIVDDNLDDALLLADVPDESAVYALRSMATRRLSAGAKQDALRLLRAEIDPAKTRGRYSVVAYNAAQRKAEVAGLAVKAGDYQWGRRLIDDAAGEVQKHVDDPLWVYARAAAAEALAAFDPTRAMRVWRTLPRQESSPGGYYDHDARIAAALAADDLSDARTILDAVEKEERPRPGLAGLSDKIRAAMAHELARTSIDAALVLLDEHNFTRPGAKAEALSWLAITVAECDKPRAWELIDRAFDACLEEPANRGTGFDGGRPFNAARIAIKAQKIDYPDMPSVVDRVLATRATSEGASSAVALVESTLMVARLLALIEPALARELLVSIEPQSALIGTGGDRTKRGDWLLAWALVDLDRAQKLFDDEFAAQRNQPKPELTDSGLIAMLELLATPPDERPEYLERDLVYTFLLPMSD